MTVEAKQLSGILPPVPTPFNEQGEIAADKLIKNIKELVRTDLTGFIVLGSNGEYVYLDEDEKLKLCEAAREAIPGDRLLVAGTGTESTRATLRLTKAAAQVGADVAIIITPAYYKPAMTVEALIKHFLTIAEASPIPVVLYNMPAYTGVDLATDTILSLAEHPNIIGLKESSGNVVKIAEIVQGVKERDLNFSVLAGSASFLLASLAVGASGGIVASANVAARDCLELYQTQTRPAEALIIQQRLLPLNAAVTSRFGVAGLKYAMEKTGLYGGPVRPPLLPLAAKGQTEIDYILATIFPAK